jgi:perosamine synthetase
MIPVSEPTLGRRELAYLEECISGGWVSADGPFVARFERAVAELHGPGFHAAACSSGTAALQLALISLGLRPGELVIVPALSFVATLNPILHLGAEPVLLDVESETLGLDPAAVSNWLERETVARHGARFERRSGRRVFGLLPVHLYGLPCAVAGLAAIAAGHGLVLLEDNAEALGALSAGRPTGSWGQASIVSFNGNKAITAGGGGMVLSEDAELIARAAAWSNHGRRSGGGEPLDYGFNLRISNLQAAVGLAQVERAGELLGARRRHHAAYTAELAELGLSLVPGRDGDRPSRWLHLLRLPEGCAADELQRRLLAEGVQSRRVFTPFHRMPLYAPFARGDCPVADRLHGSLLALPSSAHLSTAQRRRVVESLGRILRRMPRTRLAEALP